MIRYGLIQLSDLQFGNKHRFDFPSKIANSLSEDIKTMSEKYQFIPIYLLLTGDIAETAHTTEFDDAIETINKLALKIGIDNDSILAIPGNHDINWKLSEIASQVGDLSLKYYNYNKFSDSCCNPISLVNCDYYNRFIDHRLGIEILLLNSCEKEDHQNHLGYIEKEKLLNSIALDTKPNQGYTKICLCHHRIDSNKMDKENVVDNSFEI